MGKRGDNRGHADAPEPHNDDGLAGLRPSGVDDCPAAGQHGAAEQRRDRGRDVRGHRHDRATVDDGVRGEAGDAKVVVDELAVAGQPPCADHQRASALAAVPGSHGVRPLVAQAGQWPHRGRNVMTTRCPTGISETAEPACSTTPAASCPAASAPGASGCRPPPTDRNDRGQRSRRGPGVRCRPAPPGRGR